MAQNRQSGVAYRALATAVRCVPLVALIALVPAILRGTLNRDALTGAAFATLLGFVYVFLVAVALEKYRSQRGGRPS